MSKIGVLGAGTNRMNKYIVRKTTQGFAEYIKKAGDDACRRGIVIAHDNRRYSVEFCRETAGVLAANGIQAYIFDSLRPTPELSYAVRHLGAFGGVVITASHNPPEYNGYKLYDERGCQPVGESNDRVIEEINKIPNALSVKALTKDESGELIKVLDPSMDETYYKNPNTIVLSGYICKPPIYRTTPFNREIADILIAVNHAYNKSDYIPCIAWGRNARFVKNLEVGEKVSISGRIQSREYQKKISETETRFLTAYEVSISKLAAYDNAETFDLDKEFELECDILQKETV